VDQQVRQKCFGLLSLFFRCCIFPAQLDAEINPDYRLPKDSLTSFSHQVQFELLDVFHATRPGFSHDITLGDSNVHIK